jgi:hypothetical protein
MAPASVTTFVESRVQLPSTALATSPAAITALAAVLAKGSITRQFDERRGFAIELNRDLVLMNKAWTI